MFEEKEQAPEVLSMTNVALAVLVHLLFFLACWLVVQPLKTKEVVIPIDLTLVLHENLDGSENEPPPMEKPKPQPPAPNPPKPKPEPPTPKQPEKAPDAVVKTAEKPKPKPPEPPKKTAKELREERMKKMLESAKVVKNKEPAPQQKPQQNGRTGPKTLSDAEIKKLLAMGYKPGATEQLATSEEQLCVSLIYKAYYDKWDSPAYSPSLKEMLLRVRFDGGGRVVDWQLVQSSGDATADASVKRAAQLVKYVPGLTSAFLRANKTVTVRFKVKPQ